MVALGCNAAIRFVAETALPVCVYYLQNKQDKILTKPMWYVQCKGVKWTGGNTSKNSKIRSSGGGDNFIFNRSCPLSHTNHLPEAVSRLVFRQWRSGRARWWAHTLVSLLHCHQQCSARSLWYFLFSFLFCCYLPWSDWRDSLIMEWFYFYRGGHWSRMASFCCLGEHCMLLPIWGSSGSRTGLQGRPGCQGNLHYVNARGRESSNHGSAVKRFSCLWTCSFDAFINFRGSGVGCFQGQLSKHVYSSGWFIEPTGIKR